MEQHYPIIPASSIPFITVEQMIEVDRLMMEEYQISLEQMMENAAYNLAQLSTTFYPAVENFIILAGKGNNGGGGLGAARRLHNWGFTVIVLLASEETSFKEVPAKQLEILKKLNIRIYYVEDDFEEIFKQQEEKTLIIDALLGYSLKGNPQGKYAYLINKANESDLPIISLSKSFISCKILVSNFLNISSCLAGTALNDPSSLASKTVTEYPQLCNLRAAPNPPPPLLPLPAKIIKFLTFG